MAAIILGSSDPVIVNSPSINLTGVNVVEEVPISINTSHSELSNLIADDHIQYHNNTYHQMEYCYL